MYMYMYMYVGTSLLVWHTIRGVVADCIATRWRVTPRAIILLHSTPLVVSTSSIVALTRGNTVCNACINLTHLSSRTAHEGTRWWKTLGFISGGTHSTAVVRHAVNQSTRIWGECVCVRGRELAVLFIGCVYNYLYVYEDALGSISMHWTWWGQGSVWSGGQSPSVRTHLCSSPQLCMLYGGSHEGSQ